MTKQLGQAGALPFAIKIAIAAVAIFFNGCNFTAPTIISGATFTVEPNLETINVQLNFGPTVQSDLGGSYDLTLSGLDYGDILIQPSSPAQPFSVGFALNLNIVNDQNVVNLSPVQDLPSGQPIPIPNLDRAFAQIKLDTPVGQDFDVYAYVDVAGKQWLGVAVVLNFLNTSVFPAGLTISQSFDNDSTGNAQIWGSFFGPKVDTNGNMVTAGGIALFANAAELIGVPLPTPTAQNPTSATQSPTSTPQGPTVAPEIADQVSLSTDFANTTPTTTAPKTTTPNSGTFTATQNYQYAGTNAQYYSSHPQAAAKLGDAFTQALKQR